MAEPLLNFSVNFSVKDFADKQFTDNEKKESFLSSARLIGQDDNGNLLIAWEERHCVRDSEDGEQAPGPTTACTVVSLAYRIGKHEDKFNALYRHEEGEANICAASVNSEHTLLAYTIKTVFGEDPEDFLYDTYVAETQPQGRVFSLELQSNTFRKLQFLNTVASPYQRSRIGRQQQMARLLVLVPEQYVMLYTFQLQNLKLGTIIANHPEQEIITTNLNWYQWNEKKQWLYYACFETTNSPVQASVSGRNSLVLHCLSFVSSPQQLLLTVSLPLPYFAEHYVRSTTHYHSPLSLLSPICERNLQVLSRGDGFWCVCLQHCNGTALADEVTPGHDIPSGTKVDYTVYIIHNGHMIYGQVPLSAPSSQGLCIHFMLIGKFVTAYIPGVMLHLLNVGPHTDPLHNLAFDDSLAPTLPALSPVPPILSSVNTTLCLGDFNTLVMECNSAIIYNCKLNIAAFFQLFKTTSLPSLRESLLHLVIAVFQDRDMALSMLEHVCRTPVSFNTHCIFAEFIVCSAYANTYFDCRRYIAKQLPLSTSSSFCGNVFKSSSGSTYALLRTTALPNFRKQLLVQSNQRLVSAGPEELLAYMPADSDPLDWLCFIAATSQPDIERINVNRVMATTTEASGGQPVSVARASPIRKPLMALKYYNKSSDSVARAGTGFFGRLSSTFGRRSRSTAARSGHDPLELLTFLLPDDDLHAELNNFTSEIREKVASAISVGLSSSRSRNTAWSSVNTYFSEMEKFSCILLLAIWHSLGFSLEQHPLNTTIHRTASVKEKILFELLEAYQLAHFELGIPPPCGFHTLFACLGFMCLEPALFLQYMHSGVFVPTKRFIEHLLEDSITDKELVFQVLSSVNESLMDYALSIWPDMPTVVEQYKLNITRLLSDR